MGFNVIADFCEGLGKIHAHAFLIHMHTTSFIVCSFSLTLNNHKCILFVLMFLGKLSS
jgi:hypothetical protein